MTVAGTGCGPPPYNGFCGKGPHTTTRVLLSRHSRRRAETGSNEEVFLDGMPWAQSLS